MKIKGGIRMADLKGRTEDTKDKVVGEGKEAYGKATNDKSKETEGKRAGKKRKNRNVQKGSRTDQKT